MKTTYLFPHRYKRIGWILFLLGLILGLVYLFYDSEISLFDFKVISLVHEPLWSDAEYFSILKILKNNILNEISGILLIVGALLIAFSKEMFEDELISKIRLESLVWATYVNYAILIFAILFIYDVTFLWVMLFNMFTLLIFFMIRFNWALHKSKNLIVDEE